MQVRTYPSLCFLQQIDDDDDDDDIGDDDDNNNKDDDVITRTTCSTAQSVRGSRGIEPHCSLLIPASIECWLMKLNFASI